MSRSGIDPFAHATSGDVLTSTGFFRVNGYGDIQHYDTRCLFSHPVLVGNQKDDWWITLTSGHEDESTTARAEGHSEGYSDGYDEGISYAVDKLRHTLDTL